jgi:hypothetical protein
MRGFQAREDEESEEESTDDEDGMGGPGASKSLLKFRQPAPTNSDLLDWRSLVGISMDFLSTFIAYC